MYEIILNNYKFCNLTEEYLEQTALLLNQEWPRSLSLRKHTLQSFVTQYNDNKLALPTSLILLQISTSKVIGHTSINSIAVISSKKNCDADEFENLAFLQSVIIDKELRGKGLGKKLMELSEQYLLDYGRQENIKKNTNCDYLYLTTKDKQHFYEALGYEKIEPIKFYSVKENKCTEIMKRLYSRKSDNESIIENQISKSSGEVFMKSTVSLPAPPPPPPPPPPPFLPIYSSLSEITLDTNDSKMTWYKKFITNK
jgi:GNAT superfamily N-acetyltransferase